MLVLVVMMVAAAFGSACVQASSGDNSPVFKKCVQKCLNRSCRLIGSSDTDTDTNKQQEMPFDRQQPLWLRLLGWNCLEECRYQCKHNKHTFISKYFYFNFDKLFEKINIFQFYLQKSNVIIILLLQVAKNVNYCSTFYTCFEIANDLRWARHSNGKNPKIFLPSRRLTLQNTFMISEKYLAMLNDGARNILRINKLK